MFKNYFTTAFRGFRRHKSSFFINLIGLSIGLTCSFLIVLWVLDELKMDQYHSDIELIYQVMEHQSYSGEVMTTLSTPGILARSLKRIFPNLSISQPIPGILNIFSRKTIKLFVKMDYM